MTAFTKRLNWSQLVLEGLRDFLHVLTPDRRILYASPSCKAVTGFDRSELEGRFVSAVARLGAGVAGMGYQEECVLSCIVQHHSSAYI